MIKAYKIKSEANKNKIDKVKETLNLYRKDATKIAKLQWKLFEKTNKFDKQSKININSKLSARYQQTCQYQVVSILKSYMSNNQNTFATYVYKSSIKEELKHTLHKINRRELWNCQEHKDYKKEELWLARRIMKGVMKNKPRFSGINMALDAKVAEISVKKDNAASEFEYWIRMSTKERNKPIYLPMKTNSYYERSVGDRKNFCQINVDRDNNLAISFIKGSENYNKKDIDSQKRIYDPVRDKLGLDFGLVTLFTDNRGGMYGRSFFDILKKADKEISAIAKKNRQTTGKVRSVKYDKLVSRFRETFKNEISRVLNRIVEVNKPAEIILERLNFQSSALSKRMNRLLSNYGKRYITAKLNRFSEEFGIKITYINPAYTSQECSSCGYIEKKNRKSQSEFLCMCCGLKINADVNAPRVMIIRSSCESANIFLNKYTVLRIRISKFLSERCRIQDDTRYYSLTTKLSNNYYYSIYKEIAKLD